MSNQTIKNDLKRSNWPKWFFSWKATNKIFMYLWAPFIVQNLKNIFRANLEFRGCVIFGSEMTHLPWTHLFWYKPLLLPSSTYWHFSVCKILKKILPAAPESWGHTIFESKMVSLPQTNFFFGKKLWTLFSYIYWHLLLWKILKNSYSGSRVMRIHHFLGHKWLICYNENFFQKTS